jgi:hypothetical protein
MAINQLSVLLVIDLLSTVNKEKIISERKDADILNRFLLESDNFKSGAFKD